LDRDEPLPDREVAVVEDRARRDAEEAPATAAVEPPPCRDRSDGASAALRATDPVGPAQLLEVAPAAPLGLPEVAEPAGTVKRRGGEDPRWSWGRGEGTTRPSASPGSQTIQPPR